MPRFARHGERLGVNHERASVAQQLHCSTGFAGLTCRPFEERVSLLGNVSFVATKSYAANLSCSWVIHPTCAQPCGIVATITNIDLEAGTRIYVQGLIWLVCKPRVFNRL